MNGRDYGLNEKRPFHTDDIVPGYSPYRYFICHRGKFEKKTEQVVQTSPGTWNFDTVDGVLCLFSSCPCCGAPNRYTSDFLPDGKISGSCIVCRACGAHFFPMLMGWKSSFRIRIGSRLATIRRIRHEEA